MVGQATAIRHEQWKVSRARMTSGTPPCVLPCHSALGGLRRQQHVRRSGRRAKRSKWLALCQLTTRLGVPAGLSIDGRPGSS